jgi:hypothetical protein
MIPCCLSYVSSPDYTRKVQIGEEIYRTEDKSHLEDDDAFLFYPLDVETSNGQVQQAFTMYKKVDKKIRPVSTTFPPDYEVWRTIPENPLKTLEKLPVCPPDLEPSTRLTKEQLEMLELNMEGYLTKEEEKLFAHIMKLNQDPSCTLLPNGLDLARSTFAYTPGSNQRVAKAI